MPTTTMHIKEPYWGLIREGRKPVEGRKASPTWAALRPGDTLQCVNDAGAYFMADVTAINVYPSIPLSKPPAISPAMPGCSRASTAEAEAATAAAAIAALKATDEAATAAAAIAALGATDEVAAAVATAAVARACLRRFLEAEGLDRALPGVATLEEGVAVYLQWSTPEEIARYGMLGIQLRVRGDGLAAL